MFKKFPPIYNFLRFLMLPLREIDSFLPESGTIIELGCGEGVIAKYVAIKPKRNVIGIDHDKQRLPAQKTKNLKFILGDITTYSPQNPSAVIISDVLHHLNFQDQKALLSKISGSLPKKGIFLIKEIDTQEFVRSKISRFWDFLFYPEDKIYYWDSQNLKNFLEKLNFSVRVFRPTRFFPGSTTLFVCKKE